MPAGRQSEEGGLLEVWQNEEGGLTSTHIIAGYVDDLVVLNGQQVLQVVPLRERDGGGPLLPPSMASSRPRRGAFHRAERSIGAALADERCPERLHDCANEAAATSRAIRASLASAAAEGVDLELSHPPPRAGSRLVAVSRSASVASAQLRAGQDGAADVGGVFTDLVDGLEFRSINDDLRREALKDQRLRAAGFDLTIDSDEEGGMSVSDAESVEIEVELDGELVVKASRRRRCGSCAGCLATACNKCPGCLDKPSNGVCGTLRRGRSVQLSRRPELVLLLRLLPVRTRECAALALRQNHD